MPRSRRHVFDEGSIRRRMRTRTDGANTTRCKAVITLGWTDVRQRQLDGSTLQDRLEYWLDPIGPDPYRDTNRPEISAVTHRGYRSGVGNYITPRLGRARHAKLPHPRTSMASAPGARPQALHRAQRRRHPLRHDHARRPLAPHPPQPVRGPDRHTSPPSPPTKRPTGSTTKPPPSSGATQSRRPASTSRTTSRSSCAQAWRNSAASSGPTPSASQTNAREKHPAPRCATPGNRRPQRPHPLEMPQDRDQLWLYAPAALHGRVPRGMAGAAGEQRGARRQKAPGVGRT